MAHSWDNKLTELNRILAELYPRKEQSYRIVDMAEIPAGGIAFKDAALENWYYILKEAKLRTKVNSIVQIASVEFPDRGELKQLYQEVNQTAVLQTAANYQPDPDFFKALFSQVETKEIIARLLAVSPEISNSLYNDVLMQSSRFNRIEKDRNKGLLYEQDYRVETAKIDQAILHIIDQIPQELKFKTAQNLVSTEALPKEKIDLLIPNSEDLQKIIGRGNLLEISWLTKAQVASQSVCKVLQSNNESGTGFLIKGGYVLTNHHVLPDLAAANRSKLIFNYRIDDQENVLTSTEYMLDSAVFFTNPELDYSLIKVKENGETPLSAWKYLELDNFSDPQIEDRVNIIQHPEGKFMKIALPDQVISVWKNSLFYLTDTLKGSSGSPVFNQDWKVIAIHHAGKNGETEAGGLVINAAGEKRNCNTGILIKPILEDLSKKGINLQ